MKDWLTLAVLFCYSFLIDIVMRLHLFKQLLKRLTRHPADPELSRHLMLYQSYQTWGPAPEPYCRSHVSPQVLCFYAFHLITWLVYSYLAKSAQVPAYNDYIVQNHLTPS